jgi:hypothetical protein
MFFKFSLPAQLWVRWSPGGGLPCGALAIQVRGTGPCPPAYSRHLHARIPLNERLPEADVKVLTSGLQICSTRAHACWSRIRLLSLQCWDLCCMQLCQPQAPQGNDLRQHAMTVTDVSTDSTHLRPRGARPIRHGHKHSLYAQCSIPHSTGLSH